MTVEGIAVFTVIRVMDAHHMWLMVWLGEGFGGLVLALGACLGCVGVVIRRGLYTFAKFRVWLRCVTVVLMAMWGFSCCTN